MKVPLRSHKNIHTQTKEHTPTFYKYYALHINEYIVIIAGYMY